MHLVRLAGSLLLATLFTLPATAASDWQPTLREIDALFEKFAADTHAPGLVYGVVRDGRLFHVHGIGVQDLQTRTPVTADSVFRIASLTKSFTALAALQLRDAGRLELDARVTSLLPELALILPVSSDAARPMRVSDLLHHTAGFVTDDPWGDRQLAMSETAFTEYLRGGIPLARLPGEAFEYSNTGYALLGRIVSTAARQPYQQYIRHTVLQPLQMTATYWDVSDIPAPHRTVGYSWVDGQHEAQVALGDGAYGAMAGLSTTATDYARYVAWLLSAWQPGAARIPGSPAPATVREAGTGAALSQVGQRTNGPDGQPCPVAWLYGAGFYVVADCELGTMLRHPGGLPGYGSQVLLLPQANLGIFAFATLTYAHLSEPVVEAALRLQRAGLLAKEKTAPSPALLRAAEAALRIYASSDVGSARSELAGNLLLDRSAARRNVAIREIKDRLGACRNVTPAEMLHALGGRFRFTCEHGAVMATILLAPTSPPTIQFLEFEAGER